jgi:hypothetical protein
MNYRERCEAVAAALRESSRESGVNALALCPFCVSSKTGGATHSLSVNRTTGAYWCHRCEVRGYLRGDEYEAPTTPTPTAAPTTVVHPDGFLPLWDGDVAQAESLADARTYLTKRGCGPALWGRHRVGVVLDGYYARRVVVSIADGDGRLRGWVARAYDPWPHARPYLYAPGMPRAELLFNRAALDVATDVPVLVVEGVFDAMPFGDDAVAVLGKPSEAQVLQLLRAHRPVCVVLDGDAWCEGQALAMRLRFDGARAGAVRLPPRTDPDEVDAAWLRSESCRACAMEFVL